MWQPSERRKHSLPIARWPTADEAARARLFSPVTLGPRTARERTWVPAMVPWRATDDGLVTPDVIDWYRRFAEGRPGVIVVEATGIRDIPSGPLLRIGHDRFLPGLRDLVAAVREASGGETLLFIQIIDFLAIRRRPPRDRFVARFLAITDAHRAALAARTGDPGFAIADEAAVREALAALDDDALLSILTPREREDLEVGYRERVTDVHLPHIAELPAVLPGLFASAAARAEAAGFDGVELHYAHAYTMASFLSALNTRADGYGGPREQRVRLPLEVIARTRAALSPRTVLGCRFLGDDVVEGGSHVDDAAWFGARFAEAGLDFLSVSKGGKFEDAKQPKVGWAAYPYTGRSGYECMPTIYSDERGPFGRNLELAAAVRAAVRAAGYSTPVVGAGGIGEFGLAEAALARGDCDLVASARQSLADPDWFEKVRTGHGAEVRRCEFTNYCEALDQQHKQVTCKLWDRDDLDEPGVTLAADGKRRLLAPRWRRPT
ncbi:MAG TPA: NADH:flavin oxidoreductase [Kofleriaceae bacterium]|nr:NADH:flavin oxidoreductase [Kofleriaceae bacterium]